MAAPQRAPRVGGVEGRLGRRPAGRRTLEIAQIASERPEKDVAESARRHPKTSCRRRRRRTRKRCRNCPWARPRSTGSPTAARRRHLVVSQRPRSPAPSSSTARTRTQTHKKCFNVEKSMPRPEAHRTASALGARSARPTPHSSSRRRFGVRGRRRVRADEVENPKRSESGDDALARVP